MRRTERPNELTRTSFSESPRHLLTMDEAEMLKNVVWHSVATAFASSVFPVPGGPYSRRPFHGVRMPVNSCGYCTRTFTFTGTLFYCDCDWLTSSHRTASHRSARPNIQVSVPCILASEQI